MNKKLFSKWAAVLMPLAIFLPTNKFHYFIPGLGGGGLLVGCLCVKFQVWKGAKISYIVFFSSRSLLNTSLTGKWVSGRKRNCLVLHQG